MDRIETFSTISADGLGSSILRRQSGGIDCSGAMSAI
jgi:hypothetical protein